MYRKTILVLFIFISSTVLFNFCSKDDENVTEPESNKTINGRWTFTLSPKYYNPIADDPIEPIDEEYDITPATFEEVYLYQVEYEILGFCGPFKFKGTIESNSVSLFVYEPVDGVFGKDTSMILTATMELQLNAFNHLTVTGISEYETSDTSKPKETFLVYANKEAVLSKADWHGISLSSIENKFCSFPEGKVSRLISSESEEKFRPMAGSCWGKKDGKGYWLSGDIGPGNGFTQVPVWTQTVYVPYAFKWCHCKRYDFEVKMKGELFQIEALKISLKAIKWIGKHLGFETNDLFVNEVEDFYEKHGHFAITYSWSSKSNSVTIFVNIKDYDHIKGTEIKNHKLISIIADNFEQGVSVDYVNVRVGGTNLYEHRALKYGTCPLPIIYGYVVGTHSVLFNEYSNE